MRADRSKMFITACLIASIFGLRSGDISAQEYIEHEGLIFGGWAGYGLVNVDTDSGSRNSQRGFALGFRGGYAITSRVTAGLELNGWTLKAYDFNDPSKGESISNVSVYISYFPFKHLPVYFAGGGGQTSYTNNSPGVNGRNKGGSWFVGSGYEYQISRKLMLVPQIRYCQGHFWGGKYNAYEIALGMNWYSEDLHGPGSKSKAD